MVCHERQKAKVHGHGGRVRVDQAERRVGALYAVEDLVKVLCKHVLRNRLAVDLDAFADLDQVRRGEEADFKRARCVDLTQDAADEGASRAFALGAGDMDDVEAVEVVDAVAQLFDKRLKLGNAELVEPSARLFDLFDDFVVGLQAVEVVDGGLEQ
ncbi:hypothetical protein IW150_004363 [Coemansia sp. RSA 2607]|nr:hypothetical protein IW150_004363 [Coemansia sp. RSA 2607]